MTPNERLEAWGLGPKPDVSRRRSKTLAPVRPNIGVQAAYHRRLQALIDEMNTSIVHWMSAAYRRNDPEVAQLMAADEAPSTALLAVFKRLATRWQRRFDRAARDLAKYFATTVARRSDAALMNMLRRGGFSVRFQMTPAIRDALNATTAENVALIRSIPQQYLTQVEGMVMRSVAAGRDLYSLSEDLQKQYGVTKRRAALIARDQNNKATAIVTRVRHAELGITKAVWLHSGGGKHPRASHLKAGRDKAEYDIATGWFDPDEGEFIYPGELINCRCVAKPIVAGFS